MKRRTGSVSFVVALALTSTLIIWPVTASSQKASAGQSYKDSPTARSRSQEDTAASQTPIPPSHTIKVEAPVKRTLAEMEQADLAESPLPFEEEDRNMITMDPEEYAEAKAVAEAERRAARPFVPEAGVVPLAPPTIIGPNFEGNAQLSAFPPDTHGAVGTKQYVEVTNQNVSIYNKTTGVRTNGCSGSVCKGVSLSSFFGYTTQGLFDPRVVHDRLWKRWVVTADAFAESSTKQLFFFAISSTEDATSPYFIYAINVTLTAGDFWDYPQVGLDQDAVIFTANIFSSTGAYKGADMFTVAKALLYNGFGFSVPVFTALKGTLAATNVLDQNPSTFLIAATPNNNVVYMYTLTNSSRPPGEILTGPVSIPVTSYTVPPNAPQPAACAGTSNANKLDTLDNRFQNASTQNGTFIYNVHSINLVGFSSPRYYKINTSTKTVAESGMLFASSTSHDFNPSIEANFEGDMAVTWSDTDPTNKINAQVRLSGKRFNDAGTINHTGLVVFTSTTCLTGNFDSHKGLQRWGDYSAVSFDLDTNQLQFYIVNEKINTISLWGSRIARGSF